MIDLGSLLTEAETKYKNLDDWPGVEEQDSALIAEDVICDNCGEKGHCVRNCPKPHTPIQGVVDKEEVTATVKDKAAEDKAAEDEAAEDEAAEV